MASQLALSRPTVTALVEDLKKLDWAYETHQPLFRTSADRSSPALGRPEGTIRLSEAAGYVGVISAGHTTLRVMLASSSGVAGTPKRASNAGIDVNGPMALEKGIALLEECLKEATVSADQLRAIAVGVPAPLYEQTGRLAAPSFMRSLAQTVLPQTVLDLFQDRFGTPSNGRLPEVVVENEANAMARGALARGFAGKSENFLLLKVSSGIGSGAVLDGRVYTGASGAACEFGHLPTCDPNENREPCPRCLSHGCIETVASATAIVQRLLASDQGGRYARDILPSQIIANARENPVEHRECHRVIVRAGELIGEVLANVVSFLDLEKVIVAGVMAEAGDLLIEPMRNVVYQQAINFVSPEIIALDRKARGEVGTYGGAVLGLSKAEPLFLREL